MEIRKLELNDLESYRSIRLELLKKYPTNFGSSSEEESAFDEKMWVNRLSKDTITPIGAFIEGEIVGIVLTVQNPRKKMKHIAHINSMYVKDEYMGKGIGDALIKYAVSLMKEKEVEIIYLSVVSDNTSAINLYQKNGFSGYGIEPKTIKHEGKYHDLLLMSLELVDEE